MIFPVVLLVIRAANATGFNAYEGLVGTDRRRGEGLDIELCGAVNTAARAVLGMANSPD